jgi:hypothetical protein
MGNIGENMDRQGPRIGKGLRQVKMKDEFDNDVGPGSYDIKSTIP